MVYFVGAGAGDPELLTIKGKRLIDHADVLIYAGSLVNPEVLADRKPESVVYDSAGMTLEEVLAVMKQADGLVNAPHATTGIRLRKRLFSRRRRRRKVPRRFSRAVSRRCFRISR